LSRGIGGAGSCGCFGAVKVNPFLTFALDVGIVVLLVVFRPVNAFFQWEILRLEFKGIGESRRRFFVVLPFWLILAVSTTVLMIAVQSSSVAELGTEFVGIDNHKTIVLEQDKWIGKEFPLVRYLDKSAAGKIVSGDQNVIISRFDCEECRQFVEKIHDQDRYIFIMIPSENVALFSLSSYYMLPNDREWWMETPVVLQLEAGIVRNIIRREK
jgi:hypothetical protein